MGALAPVVRIVSVAPSPPRAEAGGGLVAGSPALARTGLICGERFSDELELVLGDDGFFLLRTLPAAACQSQPLAFP